MAKKRMTTTQVTDSDDFICMSSASQALYLHLNNGADDDGFNNQVQMAMFKSHASVDDLKVLLAKRFILQFENGVIVIKHWRMANAIRKDRYTPTVFQEELKQLGIKDNGAYTWLSDGCQLVATGKDSIGKDSIGKHIYGLYKNVRLTDEEFEKLQEEFPNDYLDRIEKVSSYCASTGKTYKNYLATIRNWARKDEPKEETPPVYSTKDNKEIAGDEEEELLRLMGRKNI